MSDDNQQLSIDTIKEAIVDNKELETALVTFSMQTETGAKMLNNHLKNNTDHTSVANEATKNAYTSIDGVVKEFGFEKPQDTKSTEHLKGVFKSLTDKIKDLEAKNGSNEEAANMLETVKGEYNTKLEEMQNQLDKANGTLRSNSILNDLRNVGLEFDPKIPKIAIDTTRKAIEKKLIANAKQDGDKIVYYKEDGKAYLNDVLGPATAEEILKKELEPLLKKQRARGGNAGDDTPTSEKDNDGNLVFNTASITTRVGMLEAFNKACEKQGIANRSEEYFKQWNLVVASDKYKSLPDR